MKLKLLLAIALLGGIFTLFFSADAGTTPLALPSPDSAYSRSYDSLLDGIDTRRNELAKAYKAARLSKTKDSIIGEARQVFVSSIAERIAPYWLGTTWEFYGTTVRPREGTIACGYFVSTLLRHTELKVERVRMAQQASELIVKSLATEKEIKRFRNVPLDTFVTTIDNWGEGLFVVGLDFHVGFLYHNGTEVRFIHSSYIEPKCVVNEAASGSAILDASKYRVVGKISANDELMRKWLLDKDVKTAR